MKSLTFLRLYLREKDVVRGVAYDWACGMVRRLETRLNDLPPYFSWHAS